MSKLIDLLPADFTKYINLSSHKHDDYIKIMEEMNVQYCEVSALIIKENEERVKILNSIRQVQEVYKERLGTNDIEVKLDQEDLDSETEPDVRAAKSDKRGRKKNIPDEIDDNNEIKIKLKKNTKKISIVDDKELTDISTSELINNEPILPDQILNINNDDLPPDNILVNKPKNNKKKTTVEAIPLTEEIIKTQIIDNNDVVPNKTKSKSKKISKLNVEDVNNTEVINTEIKNDEVNPVLVEEPIDIIANNKKESKKVKQPKKT